MKKKSIYLLTCLLLALTLSLTVVTYALFADSTAKLENRLRQSNGSTELIEAVFEMRGHTLHKEPFVINTGDERCLIKLLVTVDPAEICADTISSEPTAEEAATLISQGYKFWLNFQPEWKYNPADGYWYYLDIVEPGEDTKPIFTTVNWLNIDADGNWLDYQDFDIHIYKESVFAEAVNDNDEFIKSYDENGNFVEENAMRIWDIYN